MVALNAMSDPPRPLATEPSLPAEKVAAVQRRLRAVLEKGNPGATILTRTEVGPFDLGVVVANIEHAYPGSGVVRVLMDALALETRPVLLAGDFNTHTFDRGLWHSALHGASALMLYPDALLRARLLHPERGFARERLFDELHRAGFAWEPFMDRAPTLQLRDDRLEESQALPGALRAIAHRVLTWAVHRGQLRLDWICARGWRGGDGHTVRGLDGPGLASDHAPVTAHLK